MSGYGAKSQTSKNIAWWLPRPTKYKYPGGMPLYCEKWLIDLAKNILHLHNPRILNVFCGGCKYGFRVDLNPEVKPDLLWDIHRLTKKAMGEFDIILADPPYSNTEVKEVYEACPYIQNVKYPKLRYKVWAKECHKLLKPGGLFIIYHKRFMPPPTKDDYLTAKRVFVGGKPNHTPRIAIFYKKKRPRKGLFK